MTDILASTHTDSERSLTPDTPDSPPTLMHKTTSDCSTTASDDTSSTFSTSTLPTTDDDLTLTTPHPPPLMIPKDISDPAPRSLRSADTKILRSRLSLLVGDALQLGNNPAWDTSAESCSPSDSDDTVSTSSSALGPASPAHAPPRRRKLHHSPMSATAPGLPTGFSKPPPTVAAHIVSAVMAHHPTPQAAARAALPLLTLNRAWSRGAARALYATPHLPTHAAFTSLVATALSPHAIHPYARFVRRLHLPDTVADELFMGDLDAALQLFPSLEGFRIAGRGSPSVSNVLLQSLADHCGGLRVLALRGCPITDALVGLVAEKCPRLETLDLSHTRVTVATLGVCVQQCPSLTTLLLDAAHASPTPPPPPTSHRSPLHTLSLRHALITDSHLRHAVAHAPSLSILLAPHCPALTDDSVVKLAQSCGGALTRVDVAFSAVTDLGLRALGMFAGEALKGVVVSGCEGVSGEGVEALVVGCRGLREVVAHGCVGVLGCERVVEAAGGRGHSGFECAVRGEGVRMLAEAVREANRLASSPGVGAPKRLSQGPSKRTSKSRLSTAIDPEAFVTAPSSPSPATKRLSRSKPSLERVAVVPPEPWSSAASAPASPVSGNGRVRRARHSFDPSLLRGWEDEGDACACVKCVLGRREGREACRALQQQVRRRRVAPQPSTADVKEVSSDTDAAPRPRRTSKTLPALLASHAHLEAQVRDLQFRERVRQQVEAQAAHARMVGGWWVLFGPEVVCVVVVAMVFLGMGVCLGGWVGVEYYRAGLAR
ncbi:hypothetical protein HDU96_008264 [Phlyctochytrium bullatum]|nr:hypothetical protein HDU96_008264 [Phlyctochytrium bullatum]